MRSHAKASTAGSKRRIGKSRPALLLCVLAASVAALALTVGSASGATTRFLVEVFGSSAQPSFPADRGMAYDQGANHLYVIDSTADTLQRFNANGTAANFGALGSNEIDGEGTGDETPLGHLAFESNRQREQVAIDESGEATDGNVYVTQAAKDVVDIFNGEGEYLGALSESTEGGAFGEPCGVTVDDEGTVYVGDRGDDRIHVFDPAAAVPVNGDSAATSFATLVDPCTLAAGMGATDGFLFVARSTAATLSKLDAATGELKYEITTGASTVSVDPATGHVFAARNTGSGSSVDEYDASGVAEATLVSSFKPGSTVEGLALNSVSEQVYVARSSTENVEVFGPAAVIPDVVTEAPTSNTGTRATLAGTVNPDGVELDECFFDWGQHPAQSGEGIAENAIPCVETPAEIGAGTTPVAVHADISGLIPQGQPFGGRYQFRLTAINPNATISGSTLSFETPDTVSAEAASAITPTEVTLNGTVNPDTAAISECLFEWGEQKNVTDAFQAFPNSEPCVPAPGSSATPVSVSAVIADLHPGTAYVYRLRATYPTGAIFNPHITPFQVQTAGPAIEATWAEDVIYTEATLKAAINPEGSATTYHFEYGESEAYGSESDELNVGSDNSPHELSLFLDDLEPGATYHYRAVATNGVAVNEGPDRMLTTFERAVPDSDCPNQALRDGPSAKLPDCRAYEMTTPADTAGASIVPQPFTEGSDLGTDQAALDGNKLLYSAGVKSFGDAMSNLLSNHFIASRTESGWTSHSINPPHENSVQKTVNLGAPGRYSAFTEDLSVGFLWDDGMPAQTADALPYPYYNQYLWHADDERFEALTTDVFSPGQQTLGAMGLQGYSDGAEHVLFVASAQLTPDAAPGTRRQLYDYHDGELELISVMPGGEPAPGNATAGQEGDGNAITESGSTQNAISDDGSRVFWMTNFAVTVEDTGKIYARVDGDTTVAVSESVSATSNATYWTAAADGSTVIFNAGEALYRFDVDAEAPALIAGGVHPNWGVLGASEDASRVYFLSKEALTPGATSGQPNLYLDDSGAKTFIATLSKGDETGEGPTASNGAAFTTSDDYSSDFSQVTPDGRHVVFNSRASLTGYDSTSLDTGEAAVEIYRYAADEEELLCISCNPSGGRPHTALLTAPHHTYGTFSSNYLSTFKVEAAAWLPTPRRGAYTQRMVRDDGDRIFFNANDSLVPQDNNGVQDVYQWEAQGVGTCKKAGGCVDLISAGTGPHRAEFVDAGEGGGDVFFRTGASIDPDDPGLIDIYDARVNGGFPVPNSPPDCRGDACQNVPAAPIDSTPASAGFRGKGDPVPTPNCGAQARSAARFSRRARSLRRKAKRARVPKRARALHRRSARNAKRAKALSKRATRCRRAVRRTSR